jgi:transaldolase / glucose-6-phosphate isomerase
MSRLHELSTYGQSVWLHFLRRAFVERGQLRTMLDQGVRGVVIDPAIVERALTSSSDYDERLGWLLAHGKSPPQIVEALLVDDTQRAADILYPVYDASDHSDGFVVLPLDPELAHNTVSLVAEARRLGGVCAVVDRPNVMLGIPATRAGIDALRQLIADGCNVYASHIFSFSTYEAVVEAYLSGLDNFLASHSVWRFAPCAVALAPLAALDAGVDEALARAGRPELQGKAAIALARLLHARHQELFKGPRWQRYAREGAHVLRLGWGDLAPLDFARGDTAYADALIGPATIQVMDPATLFAFLDHGKAAPSLASELWQAQSHLDLLREELGINLLDDGQRLQEKALVADQATSHRLGAAPAAKRERMEAGWRRLELKLGREETAFRQTVQQLCDDRVMCRIWEHDHSLWPAAPGAAAPGAAGAHLDWLHLIEVMRPNAPRLQQLVEAARGKGYTQALVIAEGSVALAAQSYADTFGSLPHIPGVLDYTPYPHLKLVVVDSADRAAVLSRSAAMPLANTLFVLVDPSDRPGAVALFDELLAALRVGRTAEEVAAQVVVVTTPHSPLAMAAAPLPLHDLLLDSPGLRGPYTALSFAGLLPAALTGLDLERLLERAAQLAANASGCNCPLTGDNTAGQLGAAIAALAGRGRARLSLAAPPLLDSFAAWVRWLLAEALHDTAVRAETVPPPPLAAADHYLLLLRPAGDDSLDALAGEYQERGQPVLDLQLHDLYELGGFFFLWQMAAAVAAHALGANPFASGRPLPTRAPARQPRVAA